MYRKSLCLVLATSAVLAVLTLPSQGKAGVNVNINVNGPPLPVHMVPAPPYVVPIPGTYVYFAPNAGVDLLFYGGFWYRPHRGHWYQARSYNGPWVYTAPTRVPRAVVGLPPGYRGMARGHDRIPYGQLKKNWAKWEREQHWEGRPEWRDHGRRPNDERFDNRGPGPQGRPESGHGDRARGRDDRQERAWDQGDHGGRDRGEHRGR